MKEMNDKVFVEWKDVDSYIKLLYNKYKDKTFSGVYGPPRGGLVMAVMVSHYMDIPLLMSPNNSALIIDDIADSGDTLYPYKKKGMVITTMFYQKDSKVVPDFYMSEKKDGWIIFPWEMGKED